MTQQTLPSHPSALPSITAEAALTPDNLLRLSDVMQKTKFSRAFVYDLIHQGQFPQQIKLGRSSFWSENEINQFIQTLKAQRGHQQ